MKILLLIMCLFIVGCGKPNEVPKGHTTVKLANESIEYNEDTIDRLGIKGLKAFTLTKDFEEGYCVQCLDRNHELYTVWFTRGNNLESVVCGHGVKLYDRVNKIERNHRAYARK